MTANGWLQILFFCAMVLAITKPLGVYIVRGVRRVAAVARAAWNG